jgi:hypothetical protein
MSDTTPTTDSTELIEILEGWLNTKTWEESRTFLQEHTQQLLSDETLTLFDTRLAELAGEQKGQNEQGVEDDSDEDDERNKHIIQTLQQHMIILEIARTQSIDSAYTELLKPSHFALALEKLPAEICAAIKGLMAANDPEELITEITHYPILFSDEVFTTIETLVEELQQVGEERAVEGLLERYEVLLQLAEASQEDDDE